MDSPIKFIKDMYEKFDKVIFLKHGDMLTDVIGNTYSTSIASRKKLADSDILFVGCSHTAGDGHPTCETVYPTQFSKLINASPQIRGNSGKSNYLIEDILAEYELANKKVIIQFTDINRIRYFDKKENKVVHKMGHNYSRSEVEMFDDARLQYEYLRIIDQVVSKLRDCNCQFLFFQLTNAPCLEIDLYQSQYREFCYMAHIDIDRATDNLHFGVNSHQLIATDLHRKWKMLYGNILEYNTKN
jgi:hypothetical protein